MDITSIRDFYEFTKTHEMSCTDKALYFQLFMMANEQFWPEEIKASSPQMIEELRISRPSFFRARKALEKLGLISVKSSAGGNNKFTSYILNNIGLSGGKKENQLKIELVKNRTTNQSKIEPVTSQKENQLTPDEPNNGRASETPQNNKTYKTLNNKELESNILSAREGENDKKSNEQAEPTEEEKKAAAFARVREEYENNIHPVASMYEAEKLQDDVDHYGAETVIKAIQRAVLRNARSLGYVEGILRRWEANGYDDGEEGERGKLRGLPQRISKETQEYIDLNRAQLEAWLGESLS